MPEDNGTQESQGTDQGAASAAEPKRTRKARHQVVHDVVDPSTGVLRHEDDVVEDEAEPLPASVKLSAPYGYMDDDGAIHMWHAGAVVEDAPTIALLIERGVLLEP